MGLPRPDAGTPVHDYLAQHSSRKVILNWPCVGREAFPVPHGVFVEPPSCLRMPALVRIHQE